MEFQIIKLFLVLWSPNLIIFLSSYCSSQETYGIGVAFEFNRVLATFASFSQTKVLKFRIMFFVGTQ